MGIQNGTLSKAITKKYNLIMKQTDKRVSFRNNRYYVKGTNIRIDLLVGLGTKEILQNYPWLSDKQVMNALSFAKELISRRGRRETSANQIQAV